ncbi:hypothetical protein ON010_g16031 [Phytophthora cinnamomi]|nr:hypothetical protein ON010_g16031 [Phytophthora cinnamomi]
MHVLLGLSLTLECSWQIPIHLFRRGRDAHQVLEGGFQDQLVNFVTDPTLRLHDDLAQGMRLEIDFSDKEEASVYFHEGTELLSYLRNQLAALPELKDLSPKADLSTANIGEHGITTAEMESQVRIILERHHSSLLGNGNAVPTPARGRILGGADVFQSEANIGFYLSAGALSVGEDAVWPAKCSIDLSVDAGQLSVGFRTPPGLRRVSGGRRSLGGYWN